MLPLLLAAFGGSVPLSVPTAPFTVATHQARRTTTYGDNRYSAHPSNDSSLLTTNETDRHRSISSNRRNLVPAQQDASISIFIRRPDAQIARTSLGLVIPHPHFSVRNWWQSGVDRAGNGRERFAAARGAI